MNALPIRADSHRIDTSAIRQILQDMPEDWVIRGMEERDYGIDLMIEFFKKDKPTGQTVFIQVKGTRNKFNKRRKIKLGNFPVKTINYSRLFDIPFFVFYTSITSKQTYFLWLQKYADLNYTNGKVLSKQKSITIYFPAENLLSANIRKFEDIVERSSMKADGLRFLSYLADIRLHWKGVKQRQFKVAYSIANMIDEMRMRKRFFAYYLSGQFPLTENPDLTKLKNALRRIGNSGKITKKNANTVESQIEHLEEIETTFLGHHFIDSLQFSGCNEMPY